MQCKDCIHYNICKFSNQEICKGTKVSDLEIDNCVDFVSKLQFKEKKPDCMVSYQSDYENCIHFRAVCTDTDITNGHSDYQYYCNRLKKEIIPFICCKKCIAKGNASF